MVVVHCPHVMGMLAPATARVLAGWPGGVDLAVIPTGDDGAYGRWLTERWADEGRLVVCEQDVVPTPAQLADLADCGGDWCVHDYAGGCWPHSPMLGLAGFSARLRARWPTALADVCWRGGRAGGQLGWRSVDTCLARWLAARGEVPHWHWPAVRHDHPPHPPTP